MPRFIVTVDNREFDITLEYRADRFEATVNGRVRDLHVHPLHQTRALMFLDGESHEVDINSVGPDGNPMVFMQGMEIPVIVEDYSLAQMRKTAGIVSTGLKEKSFKAPMPGLVLQTRVAPGDKVKPGQPLVVIEAMKMENILKAKAAATVKTVNVKPKMSVEKGDVLLEFE